MFDKSFVKKVTLVLLLAAAAVVLSSCGKEEPSSNNGTNNNGGGDTTVSKAPPAKDEKIPLPVEWPEAIMGGTPIPVPDWPNLDKDTSGTYEDFSVPKGTTNVALKKTVTCPDEDILPEELERVVDGDMSGAEGSWVELGLDDQQITIDLGKEHEIYAILVWHYFKEARVYKDVVVQTADDADFITNVNTLFNSDIENIHGQGAGTDKYYIEMPKGKLIDAKGVKGRYVRLFSNTNSINELNHYVEVAVFGKPVE